MICFFFFFKQKTAYEVRISDWSSDVCSSDLLGGEILAAGGLHRDILAGAVAPRRVADHAARRVCFRAAVGQHGLDELEFGDRLAELFAVAGLDRESGV